MVLAAWPLVLNQPARSGPKVMLAQQTSSAERIKTNREEMQVFSHIMIGTNDLVKAKAFYDALLGTIGVPPAEVDRHRIFYRTPTGVFSVSKPINGKPATAANGGTVGFACSSTQQADAWHAAGIANGGTSCEDPPGVREIPTGKFYVAYLRDLDGNKLCALHRMG
jgi:catechol 2,3-dioxygenase-like lactoylglutathione lyase family enzyme